MTIKTKHSFLDRKSPHEKHMVDITSITKELINFPNVEETVGVAWVEEQKQKSFFPFTMQRLARLEESICILKSCKGFGKVKKNISTNLNQFHNYEFEVIELARIAKNMDAAELQTVSDEGADIPSLAEMKCSKGKDTFYIEMTQLSSMKNVKSKVAKLLEKARRQIGKDNKGFLFIDISEITQRERFNPESKKVDVESNKNKIDEISRKIKAHFKGMNTRIIGVILVEYSMIVDSDNRPRLKHRYVYIHNPHNKIQMAIRDVQNQFLKI